MWIARSGASNLKNIVQAGCRLHTTTVFIALLQSTMLGQDSGRVMNSPNSFDVKEIVNSHYSGAMEELIP